MGFHLTHCCDYYAYRFNVAMKMQWYAIAHAMSERSRAYLQMSRSTKI